MTAPVSGLIGWWADYYGNHQLVSVAVRFLHVSGLVVGGGTAVRTDWHLLIAGRRPDRRAEALGRLAGSHRAVVPSLALVVASGATMVVGDLDTFIPSRLFWTKMALFVVLLANGLFLVAAERAAHHAPASAWGRLGLASTISLTLWFVLLFVGTWLTVGA